MHELSRRDVGYILIMKESSLALLFSLLAFLGLACNTLTGAEPAATPTAATTPTLAPTATVDPNAAATGTAISQVTAGETVLPGTGEASAVATAAGTAEAPPTEATGNGDPASTPLPPGPAACPAAGQNLVLNPSFEGEYKPFGAFQELHHAPNWFPWWTDGQNNQRPEYKPVDPNVAPNRIHSGSTAQQYFKSFGFFKAGLYQSVLDIPTGRRLQFSAHGQAWSCLEFNQCPNATSVNGANMLMRVGIDPTGGTDPFADTIVWSPYFNPLDQWQVACVEAVATRDIVTLFLWSSPDGQRENQDVYWDDASLVVLP